MNVRNAVLTQSGSFNCEIEHPEFGWIPFTASADDTEAFGREIHKELSEGRHGTVPEQPAEDAIDQALKFAIILRQEAYRRESDPLRLEAEYDALISGSPPDFNEWAASVAAIKARYPLPGAPPTKA